MVWSLIGCLYILYPQLCEWDPSCLSVLYNIALATNQRCMTSTRSRHVGGLSIITDTAYKAVYWEKYLPGINCTPMLKVTHIRSR